VSKDDRMTGTGDALEGIPEALRDRKQLKPDDSFQFGCHPGVPCFNTCCRDVNILLTPLDILNLARRLKISTTEVIAKHTLKPIAKQMTLPVLMLRMNDTDEKECPFVGEKGCGVYEDRPWSCRMYPLAMAVPPARAGVEPEPMFFLLEDSFCKGHVEKGNFTVASWRENQGVDEHEDLEKDYRELHSHPWFIGGVRHLTPAAMEMYFMSTYDLDTFRRFVVESSFRDRFEVEGELIEKMRTDDEALMKFSTRWLRYALFQETTIKVREDAPPSRRNR
jgi:Fe-S-cluster containining protein